MPCTKKSGHNYPDFNELEGWLCSEQPEEIVLEHAYGMEGSATQAVFHYGVGFGITYAACMTQIHSPTTLLRPQEWQPKLFSKLLLPKQLNEDSKVKALACVRKLYPDMNLLATTKCTTPHKGAVDAIALGFYHMWAKGYLPTYTTINKPTKTI